MRQGKFFVCKIAWRSAMHVCMYKRMMPKISHSFFTHYPGKKSIYAKWKKEGKGKKTFTDFLPFGPVALKKGTNVEGKV